MDIDNRVAQTNTRLKQARLRVAICRRGNMFWLQGTFPPKPHLTHKTKPYQQRFSLGLPVNMAGLQQAERQAKLIGAELSLGQFNWTNYLADQSQSDQPETVQDWVAKFEDAYWKRRKRTMSSQNTWKVYRQVFNKLPSLQPLTLDLLLACIHKTEPDSRARQRACMVLYQFGKLAALPGLEAIPELSGDYSPKSVTPRMLPEDAVIVQWRASIKNEGWRWVYGILAAYGLRPHEVFHLDLSDFPTIRVDDETKTNARFIYPLYPEWAEQWKLNERTLPGLRVIAEGDNTKLGTKVSRFFYESSIPFTAYDLRHSYARRCFEFGCSPDLGAKLMGHSVSTHCKIYRAWIDEAVYRRAYEAIINQENRPLPPA
ncbi:MAG: integrase [Cyanobacteria bacterium P01_A01_bin.17]